MKVFILFAALLLAGCATTKDKCDTVCKEKCEQICKTEKACKKSCETKKESCCVHHK